MDNPASSSQLRLAASALIEHIENSPRLVRGFCFMCKQKKNLALINDKAVCKLCAASIAYTYRKTLEFTKLDLDLQTYIVTANTHIRTDLITFEGG